MTSLSLPFAAAAIVLTSLTIYCIYVVNFRSDLYAVCSTLLSSAHHNGWLYTHSEMRNLLHDDTDSMQTSDISTDWRYLNMIRSLMTRHDPFRHRRLVNNTRQHFSEVHFEWSCRHVALTKFCHVNRVTIKSHYKLQTRAYHVMNSRLDDDDAVTCVFKLNTDHTPARQRKAILKGDVSRWWERPSSKGPLIEKPLNRPIPNLECITAVL